MNKPVLGTWGVLQGQLDLSFNARRTSQQQVRRTLAELMPPIAVAHGQGVGDGDRTSRRAEGGLQHHGAVQVAAGHLCGVRGPDRPVARLVTQEATENRWAVEAGKHNQSIDPSRLTSAALCRSERSA